MQGTGSFTFNYQNQSLQQGFVVTASGVFSHAEGYGGQATGPYSHAEGQGTYSEGQGSHAEGFAGQAIANFSHAEGSQTMAAGIASHAEGSQTVASGSYSHAEGYSTVALGDYQHVQGQFNISSPAQSAFIIGNGTSAISKSNLVFASGSTFQVTGSLDVSGSVRVNDILTLVPRTTTPTGIPSGSFIVSGSGATIKPYFWDGSAWNPLY